MGEIRDELDLSLQILEQLRVQIAERDAEIAGLRSALADTASALADATSENYMREVMSVNERDAEIAALRQQVAELQAWKAGVPVIALYRYVYNEYEKSLPGTAPVDLKQINAWFDKVQPT